MEKEIFAALVKMVEIGGTWAVAGIAVYGFFQISKTAVVGWFIWSAIKYICSAFKCMWK